MIDWAEQGRIPDFLIRYGIRRLCSQRLRDECIDDIEARSQVLNRRLCELRSSAVAIETAAANEQHYEVPAAFYDKCLGPHRKYSSALYGEGIDDLDAAEAAMLDMYGKRAQLRDGQKVLELGCGWGSLTLWMARHYPKSTILGVSNSHSQREFILAEAARDGIENIEILTADVNELRLDQQFDRIVSIEMFEHMRNYERLLARISRWLAPSGKLFVHIFCHRLLLYPFETQGDDNWMGRYFFTGGLMPSADTLLHFQQHLRLEERWQLSGTHYQKTANAWLKNTDANRDDILSILSETYGEDAEVWFQRWRIFFMACAELFGYADGQEWLVAHYRFARP